MDKECCPLQYSIIYQDMVSLYTGVSVFTLFYLAPSVSSNITAAWYLPDYNILVKWSKVFFSNGEVQSYIVEVINNSTVIATKNIAGATSYQSQEFFELSRYEYVDIVLRAVNQFGSGPASSPERISTSGMYTCVSVVLYIGIMKVWDFLPQNITPKPA